MPDSPTVSRKTLLNVTIIVEALLLLAATGWSRVSQVSFMGALSFNYKHVLLGIGAGVLMALGGFLIYRLASFDGMLKQIKETVDNYLIPLVSELTMLDIIAIAAISGFCEEVFFRGAALQQFGSFGLILSSLSFGFFHDPTFRNISYSLLAVMYGLILGLLFIYTGNNLWAPIFAHAVHNLISLVLLRYVIKPPAAPIEEK